MENYNFGENLRIIRQAKGISQEAMSIGLGISQSSYSRLERKSSIPNAKLLEKICSIIKEQPTVMLAGKRIQDLVRHKSIRQKIKEFISLRLDAIYVAILFVPNIYFAHYIVGYICEYFGIINNAKSLQFLAGFITLHFAIYWVIKIWRRKG